MRLERFRHFVPIVGSLLLIGLCPLLIAAACPAPSDPHFIGVDAKTFVENDPGAVTLAQNAGFRWIRIGMGWRGLTTNGPDPSTWNWPELDSRITTVSQRGFSILLGFVNVPAWANGNQSTQTPPDAAHAGAYGDLWTAVINHPIPQLNNLRVGEVVAAFEVWNEPNLPDWWTGGVALYQQRLLAPMIQAIQTAKAQQGYSPALIVAPSTYSNLDRGNPVVIGPWVSGYAQSINAFSIHTYGSEASQISEIDAANSWCNGNAYCVQWWVTEGGFETSGCGQANCSSTIGASLLHTQNRCAQDSLCFKNFIFSLTDAEFDSGLIAPGDLVRGRLCYLENHYGAPLVVAPPCPCTAGAPGCDGS